MFGLLTNQEIEAVLKLQYVGRIGCHADDTTYVVPVSYAYDGKYIYVHAREGKKLEIMRRNPKICFQVDNTRDMANWQSVIAWGNFEELPPSPERDEALQHLLARNLPFVSSETVHLTAQWPFVPANTDEIKGVVFRIQLVCKSGRFELNQPSTTFAT